ncbi:MAG: tRNA lysidine(34) synthetase TilS [Slackia sp.]|nr:tRNA lysidine(34) synthetase TilS [Slackia sp.]
MAKKSEMPACASCDVLERVGATMAARSMASRENVALLMVSGGSDSVALSYLAADMVAAGDLGAVAMLHVNHKLRGAASDADAVFVGELAQRLGIPLFVCEVDIASMVRSSGGNMEAIARAERYRAAREALESTCFHMGFSLEAGRIFTAHTADDRVENFYMRSIVGTGPGGFRSMEHSAMIEGCRVCRPLLEVGRDDLRAFIEARDGAARDEAGALWREDATNADTDRFRAFVRHEIVPLAKQRNPRLLETLTRTMNLIADEDDMLNAQARDLVVEHVCPLGASPVEGFLVAGALAEAPAPLVRRAIGRVLSLALGRDARIERASIEACLEGLGCSGYVANIQGDLAVSYNKQGLRIEPMHAFRARRKKA